MKYLSDYTRDPQTELFNRLGAFFAFSKQQLDEVQIRCVKYVSMGSGLIVPEAHAQTLHDELAKIQLAGITKDIVENGEFGIIKRELSNYECYYTGDISDAVEAVKCYGYTREAVLKVYRSEYSKQDF